MTNRIACSESQVLMAGLPPKPDDALPPLVRGKTSPRAASMRNDRDMDDRRRRSPDSRRFSPGARSDGRRRPARGDERYHDQPPRSRDERYQDQPRPRDERYQDQPRSRDERYQDQPPRSRDERDHPRPRGTHYSCTCPRIN